MRGAWFGENGAASEAQTLGEIVVDIADDPFVVADPAIVGDVVVSPAVGDHSARFVVSFELDADLDSDPEVFLDGTEETAWRLDGDTTNRQARRWAYALSPATSLPDGVHPIRARLTAIDGRVVTVSLGSIVMDSAGPISSVALEPSLIGRTGTARLSVVVSEPLVSPPIVRFRNQDPGLTLETSTDSLFIFALSPTCFAGGCLPADGRYVIDAIDVVDLAGNETQVRPNDLAITVDARSPRVVAFTPDRLAVSEVDGFNEVNLDVVIDEDIADGSLSVELDQLRFACTNVGGDARRHRCSGTVTPADVEEGVRALQVAAIDAAGNVGVGTVAIVSDFSPPALVPGSATLVLTPPSGALPVVGNRARPGVTLLASMSSDEILSGPPEVEIVPEGTPIDAASPFPLPVPSTAFLGARVAEHAVVLRSSVAAGNYDVRAVLQDTVGHSTRVDLNLPFTFDAVVESSCPSLGCADVDGDGQVGFSSTCAVGIDCDDSNPTVFVGAAEIPGDGVDNGCRGGDDAPVDESVGVFVDFNAPPGGNGSRAAPLNTLPASAEVAFLARSVVGTTPVGVSLASFGGGVIVGGFDPQTWTRDPSDRSAIDVFDLVPFGALVGVDVFSLQELIGAPLVVVDSTLTVQRVSGAVMVRSALAEGGQVVMRDVRIVESILSDTQLRCVDRCTFVRSLVGAVEAEALTDVTVVNSTVSGSRNFAVGAHISASPPSGTLIIVGSAIGQTGVTLSAVAWGSEVPVRIINSHLRSAPLVTQLFVGNATLQGVALDAAENGSVFLNDFALSRSDGASVVLGNPACVNCSDVQIVRGADVIDGVHILPTSPLRSGGVNPIDADAAAAADFDGDCRVPPFAVGPDQLP